jgi:hypothetical protein
VVRTFECQCFRSNGPGFNLSILRHSGICGAADEAVFNKILQNPTQPPLNKKGICFLVLEADDVYAAGVAGDSDVAVVLLLMASLLFRHVLLLASLLLLACLLLLGFLPV